MSKVLSFGFGGFGSLSNGSVKNQPTPDISETLTNIHVKKISSGLCFKANFPEEREMGMTQIMFNTY